MSARSKGLLYDTYFFGLAHSRPRCDASQVYHSEIPHEGAQQACGFAILPLKTKARGPAPKTEGTRPIKKHALQPTSLRRFVTARNGLCYSQGRTL